MSDATRSFPLPGDEIPLFSEEEYRAAYRLIMGEEEAARQARTMCNRDPGEPEDHREWQLSSDLLDLLSLVSDDCAKRVERILKLNPGTARERRVRFAKTLGFPLG
jgi:hypothetical protein